MNRASKGSLEAEIANVVVRFQREQHGRGSNDVRTHIVGDLVLVRCSGIFTPIEAKLAVSEEGREIYMLIKSSAKSLRYVVFLPQGSLPFHN